MAAQALAHLRDGAINPNSFQNVGEIALPESEIMMRLEPDQEPQSILFYDSGRDDPDQIIIFSNSTLLIISRESNAFQTDGTFSKCRKVYNNNQANNGQLFTIAACYRESLFSWIKSNGLGSQYNNQSALRKLVHKLRCLVFLPQALVIRGWRTLIAQVDQNDDPELKDFVNYFSSSFVRLMGENG